MSIYSPFDDLQHSFIYGDDGTEDSRHHREVYLEVLNCEEVEAQRWFACGISPTDAQRFVAMGMTLEEAGSWGLNAAMVERFRALGFVKSEARNWALAGIWPDHAVHWRRCGQDWVSARKIIDHSDSAAAALAWTLVDAAPWDVWGMATSGRRPGAALSEQVRRQVEKGE
ncbi:hypothetical protein ACOCJ4_05730 [Knoellia sp. CPCC 206435]|uniref:hypothetical protein n=1 Tax=Knoellia terrae TaxID=3404797 RepID=UPI003B439749